MHSSSLSTSPEADRLLALQYQRDHPEQQPKPAKSAEELLADEVGEFFDDPLGFVYYSFPWGEVGTELENEDGPDDWQARVLEDIRDGLLTISEAIQIAVASGHGIGKTALVAWIILWFVSTRTNPQVVVTANTKEQLTNKTWRELAKWHKLLVHTHWFKWTATKFFLDGHRDTWFASAVPWSKDRSEAFAGTHERHVLMIFDEASAIDDKIWEVAEGAMTTPQAIWICFGNPTKNTGRFRECFRKFRHRWRTYQIDSRTAKKADRKKVDQWVEDYGEDSDFVRIRVRGVFPRAGFNQLIGYDLIIDAQKRRAEGYDLAPKIIGVDVARHGDDQTVILRRQGNKTWPAKKFRGKDTMQVARLVALEIQEWQPDATFVDATGLGWGVVDKLHELHFDATPVQVGERADDPEHFFNKRAELWVRTRDWLKDGGEIDSEDGELEDDLAGPEYGVDEKMRTQLEKKEDMKDRGLPSPDTAEALVMTFAEPVAVSRRTRASPGTRASWRVA